MEKTLPTVEVLVNMAEEQLAVKYPQYRGHWTGWTRVRVTKDVKTKLGLAFRKGDIVLMDPTSTRYNSNLNCLFGMAYSFRNQCDTSIKMADTETV